MNVLLQHSGSAVEHFIPFLKHFSLTCLYMPRVDATYCILKCRYICSSKCSKFSLLVLSSALNCLCRDILQIILMHICLKEEKNLYWSYWSLLVVSSALNCLCRDILQIILMHICLKENNSYKYQCKNNNQKVLK